MTKINSWLTFNGLFKVWLNMWWNFASLKMKNMNLQKINCSGIKKTTALRNIRPLMGDGYLVRRKPMMISNILINYQKKNGNKKLWASPIEKIRNVFSITYQNFLTFRKIKGLIMILLFLLPTRNQKLHNYFLRLELTCLLSYPKERWKRK